MIQKCEGRDFKIINDIINDGAAAYKGIIPVDRWKEPYMPESELKDQIAQGVQFWGYREAGQLIGVMGIQDKGDVTLIRHAYVRSSKKNKGIGSKLLSHLCSSSTKPILIGTWADATWAIAFYQKHGFHLVPNETKEMLL